MIFVVVGTQLPFDRLIRAVDSWCAQSGRGQEVFGQVGRIGPQNYTPQHFEWGGMLDADVFQDKITGADMIVGHAGMGSIITAMSLAKPIVILPRRAHLGEHRNDHQFATVKRLGMRPGIFPAMTEQDLPGLIDQLVDGGYQEGGAKISNFAQDRLIGTVRDFIHGSKL
ncbi:MAG: glucuronosyltransferase [Rhizobiales bacterium]|nr:glucuronosyltransferase [Hyphomicrobiales bacterium]